jgi:predicted P-loop ATPase
MLDTFLELPSSDLGQFWTTMFAGWYSRFPWRLSESDEPPSNLEQLNRLQEGPKNAEEEARKKLIESTYSKVRCFFFKYTYHD